MQNKPSIKKIASYAIILAVLPAIFVCASFLGTRKYYIVSLVVVLLAIFSFFLSYEHRKPQVKEIVTLAVMCAISIAGRAVFIAVPFFKPVAAMVIITAIAMGCHAGFLCGAITMLVSNFIFGQGSWTPWQMLAFGLLGFLAGVVFYNKPTRQNKLFVAIFGAISYLLVVGPVLDISSVLTFAYQMDMQAVLAVFVAGIPVNIVSALATFIFILVCFNPLLNKLNRIKLKYNL